MRNGEYSNEERERERECVRARVHEIENHIYSQERAGKVKSLSLSLVLPLGRSSACSFWGECG